MQISSSCTRAREKESKHDWSDYILSPHQRLTRKSSFQTRCKSGAAVAFKGRVRAKHLEIEWRTTCGGDVSACTFVNRTLLAHERGPWRRWIGLPTISAIVGDFAPTISCPCIESKKKETVKRATRKLGQVLKDHCSPFSPGLQCIQNCNLTVPPSISSAFLLFSSGKFSPCRSPFSGRETVQHWYVANLTVGGLLWLRQTIRTTGVPIESLNKAKVCTWGYVVFISTVCSRFVRGIMGWLKRLCTLIGIIEEVYFNLWSTSTSVQPSFFF